MGGLGTDSWQQTPVTCWLAEICHCLLPECVWRPGYFRFVVVTAPIHSLLPLAPLVRSKLSHNWNSKLLFTSLFPFPSIPEVASFLFSPPSGNNICPLLLSPVYFSHSHLLPVNLGVEKSPPIGEAFKLQFTKWILSFDDCLT